MFKKLDFEFMASRRSKQPLTTSQKIWYVINEWPHKWNEKHKILHFWEFSTLFPSLQSKCLVLHETSHIITHLFIAFILQFCLSDGSKMIGFLGDILLELRETAYMKWNSWCSNNIWWLKDDMRYMIEMRFVRGIISINL